MNINANNLKFNLTPNKSIYAINNKTQEEKETKKSEQNKNEDKKSIQVKNDFRDMIKYYEQMRKEIKEYRETVKTQKMDENEKESILKIIDARLMEVEKQIQEIKNLERQKKIDESRQKQEEKIKEIKEREAKIDKSTERDGIKVDESLKDLIKLDLNFDNISRLRESKGRLNVEKGYISPDNNPNSFNSKQYEKISKGILGLESKIKATISKVAYDSSEVNDSKVQNNEEDNKVKEENKEE